MNLWDELNLLGKSLFVSSFILIIATATYIVMNLIPRASFDYRDNNQAASNIAVQQNKKAVLHLKTPDAVRGVYMTACVGGNKDIRNNILKTIEGTQINSIVLDIKDYTGTLAYSSTTVKNPGGRGCKISDLESFLGELHDKSIYTIARITVFQDPLYAKAYPHLAVKSISRSNAPWVDRNGLAYIDPNFDEYWKYIVSIAREAHSIGFDEVNFDYIRFPSDGDMTDARFATPAGLTRVDVITNFFSYLQSELKRDNIVTSADIFGQTTINYDDIGIGQILENTLPYFDFVSPMVYPSHFINGFMGFDNPASYPYEVIKKTMISAVERAVLASSTVTKIRPWLQAFDYKAVYTPKMVRAQMQAVYDAGLTSWYLWDAANRYSKEEL